MKKKHLTNAKKTLSVFLAVMMLMTCWVFVAPEKAEAVSADVSSVASYASYHVKITLQFSNIGRGGHVIIYYYPVNADGTLNTSSRQEYVLVNSASQYSSTTYTFDTAVDSTRALDPNKTFASGGYDSSAENGPINGWPCGVKMQSEGSITSSSTIALKSMTIGNLKVVQDGTWSAESRKTKEVFYTNKNDSGYVGYLDNWNVPSWTVSAAGNTSVQVPTYGTRTSGTVSASVKDQYGTSYPGNITYSINGTGATVNQSNGTASVSVTNAALANFTDATSSRNLTLTASAAGKTSTSTVTLNAPKKEILYENLFSLADWYYSDSSKWNDGNVKTNVDAGTITITNPTTDSSTEYTTAATTGAHPSNYYSIPVTAGKTYYFVCDTANATSTEVFFMYKNQNGTGLSYPSVYFNGNGKQVATFTAPTYATSAEIRFDNNTDGTTATFSNIGVYEKNRADEVDLINWTTRPVRKVYTYNTSSAASAGLDKPVRIGYKFDGWTNADGSAYTAKTMNANRTVYSTWTAIPYDIGYDNLFSLADWSYSKSTTVAGDGAAGGEIEYDLEAGTIKVTTGSGGEAFSSSNLGAGQYLVPVTAGEEYILDFDATYQGNIQTFVFYYSDTDSVTDPSTGVYYKNSYSDSTITFTPPEGTTQIGFRFGTYGDAGNWAEYKNIGLYKKADYDAYAKNYSKVREPFFYGDTTELMKNPTREGYVFDGWYTANDVKIENVAGLAASGTVYAHWTKLFEVKFVNEDGTVLETEYVAPGANATPPTQTPYKNPTADYEYNFTGWDKSYENITANTTITAQFSEAAHNIYYTIKESPTCDTNALVTKHCTTCEFNFGDAYRSDLPEHKATGHTYNEKPLEDSSTGDKDTDTHRRQCIR